MKRFFDVVGFHWSMKKNVLLDMNGNEMNGANSEHINWYLITSKSLSMHL